jgi:hypothetical protein
MNIAKCTESDYIQIDQTRAADAPYWPNRPLSPKPTPEPPEIRYIQCNSQ